MTRWFRPGPSPHQTPLAMIGAKAGNRVLVAGADNPALSAELALVTGLNGQTTVVDQSPGAREAIETAARESGALVDYEDAPVTAIPAPASPYDIVVIVTPLATLGERDRDACVGGALRALRPGGRALIIQGGKRAGVFATLNKPVSTVPTAQVIALLERAGGSAVRLLAESAGVEYFEARHPYR